MKIKNKKYHFRFRMSILPLLLIVIILGCGAPEKEKPRAVKGAINLMKWNFARDGAVDLNGEWEFYRMKRLAPGDFAKADIPGEKNFISIPGGFYPGFNQYTSDYLLGYATYRLKIITDPEKTNHLGLNINIAHTAYTLYVNGVLIHKDGNMTMDPELIISGYSRSVTPLPSTNGVYDIIIQAKNYHFPTNSLNFIISIGPLQHLTGSLQRSNLLSMIFLIAILLLGLNQLVLFTFERSEPLYLYFGLSCFGMLLFITELHNEYWNSLFPSFPWESTGIFMTSVLYIGNMFFMAYLQRLFPLDLSKRLLYIYVIISGMIALSLFVLPADLFSLLHPVRHVHAFAAIMLYVYISVRAAVKRREDAMIVLAGLISTPVGIALDFLNNLNILDRNIDAESFSMTLFCLIQTVATMRNFIHTHQHSKLLAIDNVKLKADIEALALDHLRKGQSPITDNIENKIEAAIDYLQKNYTEDISRENLAAAMDLHPDNFSRYFKVHTGKKYSEYLNGIRIAEATRLLEETNEPIIDIAMKVGYRTLRNFNHAFISTTGRTPSDFRKSHQSD